MEQNLGHLFILIIRLLGIILVYKQDLGCRKQKKRIFRRIWISRINAASRINGISYSQLMNKFKKSNIDLNRKMLSQIAILDSSTFKSLINFNN